MPHDHLTRRLPGVRSASTYNEDTGTFEAVIATDAPVERYMPGEGRVNEVLDVRGANLDRVAGGMALLDSHRAGTFADRLGTVETIKRQSNTLVATIRLFDDERAAPVRSALRAGHRLGISIGYRVRKYEADDADPPNFRATAWDLLEVSVVNIPADAGASTRALENEMPQANATGRRPEETTTTADPDTAARSAIENPPASNQTIAAEAARAERARVTTVQALGRRFNMTDEFTRAHVDAGTTEAEFRSAITEHMIQEQERTASFPHIETRGMQDETVTRRSLVTNALLHRTGVVDELSEGAREWRGMTAIEIARAMLRASGESDRGSPNEVLKRAMHSTSDFTFILNQVTEQTLLSGYQSYPNTFDLIATRNVVSDFREIRVIDVGSAPNLLPVNEHGEFKRGTIRESQESFHLATFGRVMALTRQTLINDRLGVFTRAVQEWGRKAAKLEGDIVWAQVIENAKLADGKGLFHADHGNLGSAAALSLASLKAARTTFRKQKDLDGEPINIAPQYLFVGSDLEIEAQAIVSSTTTPQTIDQVIPEAIRSITPVYEHRLDALGTTAWFLFASAQQTMGRGLQYAYLAGQEQPFFDERVGFDIDGIEYKLRHDFGAGLTDYRFAYKNPGA
ncbi:phage prohead protease, HK97 family [Fulvimarina manganoxydans]|uniref:Phage prohead protease, HK97 family n=1 Tax=Fulvimarina manganoxydans TaxID=937218 RepID=A0A1W1ZTM9_9HYPH|nr:prohead protease/major capsid protein fusion protein [Fulvimarina manganoxydans]SMC51726.1 phage prohead protease, HK97 family [Fulvimarina manganoxydans]